MRLWLQVRAKRLIIAYRTPYCVEQVLCGALNISAQTILLFQNDFSNRLGILLLALLQVFIFVLSLSIVRLPTMYFLIC